MVLKGDVIIYLVLHGDSTEVSIEGEATTNNRSIEVNSVVNGVMEYVSFMLSALNIKYTSPGDRFMEELLSRGDGIRDAMRWSVIDNMSDC